MRRSEFYATPGVHTDLIRHAAVVRSLGRRPDALVRAVAGLLVHRDSVESVCGALPPDRFSTTGVRDAAAMIDHIVASNPSPLEEPRAPGERMIGVCYHAAVLLCSVLRFNGIPARARCGFAGYFRDGLWLDHWITERWDGERWVADDPDAGLFDVPRGIGPDAARFLSGGEAWQWCRTGRGDASTFGVWGHHFGLPEIAGNAVRDLAALNKHEMLPWDEWGRMDDCYNGRTDDAYAADLDELATVTASDDLDDISALFRRSPHYRP